ncbi:hypothetical protein [Thermoactinomyces sp. DSM 45892]|uniref:hypothetical protein n=1 Tax=Thermoactinomyces sp. DSM 45892 TaxID=1882753 RepID=UPI001160C702|nr:hypothetical protein [Thermoactinomyces sp. DSM 45892]
MSPNSQWLSLLPSRSEPEKENVYLTSAILSILLSVAIRSLGRFWCNMSERSLRVLHLPLRRMAERTAFTSLLDR